MEELKKYVSELSEKVKAKKGEIIFCLREFRLAGEITGDFIPPYSQDFFYYETGIINGELQKYGKKETPYERINFPAVSLGHQPLDKLILGEYSIPVDRKFKGFFMHEFHKGFQFEIKDLEEQLKPGQLVTNSGEFAESFSVSEIFYPGSKDPNLKDFHLLIGDKETEDFMKEKEINNYQELFNILKKPEYVEDIIIKHYNNEGEKIAKKLVIGANEIANNFRAIQSLETNVMNAHLTEDYDGDGQKIKIWEQEDLVNKYYKLKKEISIQEKKLNEYLEKESELDQKGFLEYGKMGMIRGEIIGFPEEVSFAFYSNWLKKGLIPNINKIFEKIDNHLNAEKEKGEKTEKVVSH